MRKRSGALHSQSQQEYMELAQLSQDKTGIFYDDKILKNIIKQKNEKRSSRKSNKDMSETSSPFWDFDYNQQIEEMKAQQTEVNMESHQIMGAITVIICQDIRNVKGLLQKHLCISNQMDEEVKNDPAQDNRQIDLIIGKGSFQKLGIKYWVMSFQFSTNLIASSYIQKANALYFILNDKNCFLKSQITQKPQNIKNNYYSLKDQSLQNIVSQIIQDSLNI